MKVSTDELALLRTYPQKSKIYLGVQMGNTVASARVDGLHDEGATAILLTAISGEDDFAECIRGMTVALHGVEANDRKISACFISYDPDTQILTISPNAETCTDGMYVTVFDAFHLWKLDAPTWDGKQHFPPFAIMGPPRAGFVNEPLTFFGANSYSPLGRELSNPAWRVFGADVLSGDTDAFNTADDPLILSWDTTGDQKIRFRCEDSDGEFGRTFRPVLIYDRPGQGDNPPYDAVIVNSCKWNGQGWSATLTVYGDATADNFPPEALIILWAEDWYGGTKGSIGGALRGMSEVLFCGWIRAGTTNANADDKAVSFTADSVESLMAQLTMPDFTFRDRGIVLTDILEPATLSTDQNNYNPTGLAAAGYVKLTSSADVDITGLATGAADRNLVLQNVGGYTITLKAEDSGSTAANRFDFDADVVLTPNSSLTFGFLLPNTVALSLAYDDGSSRWQVNTTPDWQVFDDLTLGKAALHLIQQRTTLPALADVFVANFDYTADRLDVPAAQLLSQLQQSIFSACFGYAAGSRFGSITLARARNVMTATQRALLKRDAITFTSQDWLTLKIDRDRFGGTAQVRLEGRLGDDTPVAAQYPTSGPAHNGALVTLSGLVFKNLDQAAEMAYLIWRRDNKQIKKATLTLANYRILEPAFQEYFSIYLPANENASGYNWTDTQNEIAGREFYSTAMEILFGDGFITVNLEGELSVFGAGGTAWEVTDDPPPAMDSYGYDQNAGDGLTGTE